MRFEPPGLLSFFKAIAPLAGLLLVMFLINLDIEELSYQLRKADWLYVFLGATLFMVVVGVPTFRLFKEYRTWKVLCDPFKIIRDPFIDIDMTEESYGDLFLADGHRVKRTAILASRSGVIVRKAAYPKLFPTFEISWSAISNIYFAGLSKDDRFGSDPFGAARITLGFAEEFILVLPWRKRFNAFIPDRIGLQNEILIGRDT